MKSIRKFCLSRGGGSPAARIVSELRTDSLGSRFRTAARTVDVVPLQFSVQRRSLNTQNLGSE